MVTPVFAESAPVYDADSMQDDSAAVADNLPPPPAPGQEAGGAFIPVQPTISSAPPTTPMSVDQRVQRIEQQISNLQNSDSLTRVDSLQDQVQTLRGQIEQLTHQLEQLQTQQKSMYSDLDGRLAQTGTKTLAEANARSVPNALNTPDDEAAADNPANDLPVVTPTKMTEKASPKPVVIKTSKKQIVSSEVKETTNQPNIAEEQQIYQTAYNLIKAKKYNDAVTALQGMLKKYPSGQFASNAHYWLGELYGLMAKNDLALGEFKLVVEMYPDSPRVSDAQLKVGLLLASQFKWLEAKMALKKVINHYPGSASARLAAEQLKQIKIAGH
jgi:tol-pal system protein YbgF